MRLPAHNPIITAARTLQALLAFLTLWPGVSHAQSFTSSNLPIIVISRTEPWQVIDSAWDGFEIVVRMGIIDNGPGKRNRVTDPYNNYAGLVRLKVQGSSSVAFPKRSFRITTLNEAREHSDAALLGMPAHEDWVLKALYQDKSLLRDDLAFMLYNQMGHYSSRSRFCEVIIDGDYRGVYQLLEKVKRHKNRVDIARLRPHETSGNDVTGGYIISLDKYRKGVDKGWYSKFKSNATHDSANFFLYYYPDPEHITPQQMAYIRNYFDKFETALAAPGYTSSTTGYRRFIDLPSFVDNFILNELSRNVDGYRASTFFHKDKATAANNKLKAGPVWDFNIAFGNASYNGGNDPYGWAYEQFSYANYVPWWWRRFLTDTAFMNALRCRYSQLRTGILSEEKLFGYIDDRMDLLNEAQARNFTRYPVLGQVIYPNPSPVPATWRGEVAYLKWWLQRRLAWMDEMLKGDFVRHDNAQHRINGAQRETGDTLGKGYAVKTNGQLNTGPAKPRIMAFHDRNGGTNDGDHSGTRASGGYPAPGTENRVTDLEKLERTRQIKCK